MAVGEEEVGAAAEAERKVLCAMLLEVRSALGGGWKEVRRWARSGGRMGAVVVVVGVGVALCVLSRGGACCCGGAWLKCGAVAFSSAGKWNEETRRGPAAVFSSGFHAGGGGGGGGGGSWYSPE